jgi:hypothetical protein
MVMLLLTVVHKSALIQASAVDSTKLAQRRLRLGSLDQYFISMIKYVLTHF